MAVTYATISGQFLDVVGDAFPTSYTKNIQVGHIEAATANGLLIAAGKVLFKKKPVMLDPQGNASVTLPCVPQVDISPSNPFYKLVINQRRNQPDVVIYFQISADMTWDQVMASAVGNISPEASLLTTLNGLLADLGSGYDPAGIRKALSPWFAALMNVDAAPAYAMAIADSVGEGYGSGGFFLRWQYLLQQSLRAAFPVTGVATPGVGWIPAATVIDGPHPPVTLSGAAANQVTTMGAGQKCVRMSNAGYAEWAAQQCDRIRVWYAKRPTFTGNGNVTVDGVSKGTFSSNGTLSDGYVVDTGALTAGSHTLRVTGTSAAAIDAIVTAAEFFNGDFGKGVHIVDGAHYGANTGTFLNAEALTGHWQVAATIKPQLYIVMLGLNDWGAGATAFASNLDGILAQCAAANGATPYSVLLVMPYRPVRNFATDPAEWLAMRAALYARASNNVAVFDLGASWPDLVLNGGTETGVMFEDDYPLHANGPGHKLMARIFHRILAA